MVEITQDGKPVEKKPVPNAWSLATREEIETIYREVIGDDGTTNVSRDNPIKGRLAKPWEGYEKFKK